MRRTDAEERRQCCKKGSEGLLGVRKRERFSITKKNVWETVRTPERKRREKLETKCQNVTGGEKGEIAMGG